MNVPPPLVAFDDISWGESGVVHFSSMSLASRLLGFRGAV